MPANDSSESFQSLSGDCACPGYTQIYECTVMGIGNTVWRGSGFDCQNTNNEITLLSSRFASEGGTNGTCNDGTIVASSLKVENNSYTSQLNVTVTCELIERMLIVECIHEQNHNGTTENKVGSFAIKQGWPLHKMNSIMRYTYMYIEMVCLKTPQRAPHSHFNYIGSVSTCDCGSLGCLRYLCLYLFNYSSVAMST